MIKFLFFFISFLFLMNFSFAASFTDDQKQVLSYENLYTNGGAESGLSGWSKTGGGTLALESTTKRSGKKAIKFTSSAASDTLNFQSVTVKKGTNNCESTFYYKTTSTAFSANVYYSTYLIATLPLPANTEFTKATVTFVCPLNASTNTTKITGGANTDIIYIDDGWIGENRNIGSVNMQDKQYDLTTACSGSTCISSSTGCSTVYALAVPYRDRNGNWRLRYNLAGNSCSSGTTLSMTISGVTTKNTSWSWAQSCSTDNTSNSVLRSNFSQSGGTATCVYTNNETKISASGDVALESMPTWATDFAASTVVNSNNANTFGYIDWYGYSQFSNSSAGYATMYNASNTSYSKKYGSAQGQASSGYLNATFSNLKANTLYRLKAIGEFKGAGSGQVRCEFKILFNGSTIIERFVDVPSTGNFVTASTNLEGIYYNNSFLPSATFSVQSKLNSGSGSCYVENYNNHFPAIVIEEVYPTQAVPQLVNSVYSNYTGISRVVYGTISSTGAVSNSGSGDWSATKDGTGEYHITFSQPFSSTNYSCTYTIKGNTAPPPISELSNTNTTTTAYYSTRNTSWSTADYNVNFQCTGNK